MCKLKQDIKIGDNLKRLRKRAGLTQVQVVAQLQLRGCNIIRVTYSKMENSNYNIRISELVALKEIFKAEYSEFFEGIETPAISD